MMLSHFITLALLFVSLNPIAQTLDDSWSRFYSSEADSSKVKVLLDIGYNLEMEYPDSALIVYEEAELIARKSGYLIGAGRALMYSGIVKSSMGEHSESLETYNEALTAFEEADYEMGIAGTHVNIGVVHNYRGEFDKAIEAYLKGIRVYEDLNAKPQLVATYGNIGGVFIELGQNEKGFEYFQKERGVAYQVGDTAMVADAHINLGLGFQRMGLLDSAEWYFRKCLGIAERNELTYLRFLSYNNMADIMAVTKSAKAALPFAQEAVRLSRIVGNPYNRVNAYKGLGVKYMELNEFEKADKYLDSAVQVGLTIGAKDVIAEAYQFLAESKASQGDYKNAFAFQQLHESYSDSVFEDESVSRLNELELAYETEKKDRAIAESALELERNQELNSRMVVGVISLAILILFMLVFFKQKQLLKEREVLALRKEQEVGVIRAMIQGEENERRRIARDLHDGLSALLASVKMSFSSVEDINELEPAVESLDEAAREVRRIAHNMMPEVLMDYGLEVAIKEFVESIRQGGKQVDLQFTGVGRLNDQSTELMIYRIVQELLNNVLKHAQAEYILVQITRVEDIISITVEDNGVGIGDISKSKGLGMKNLQARVNYLQGTLSVENIPEGGTSVFVEIPLKD